MLNRNNLEIAKLVSRDPSHFTLSAIRVSCEETAETDGHQLIRVTRPAGAEQPTHAPFLLPAATALQVAKAVGGGGTIEVTDACLTTDNQSFVRRDALGNFPDIDRVMPDPADATMTISFNAHLLATVLQQVAKVANDEKHSCIIRLYASGTAIRIDAYNQDKSQVVTAVVMPLNLDSGGGFDPCARDSALMPVDLRTSLRHYHTLLHTPSNKA
jgi:DNA polymerase III sliding clamp (beta) subunit (PCNA family)